MRLWPTCNKEALQKHLREYKKLKDILRPEQSFTKQSDNLAAYRKRLESLDRLILACEEEIKYV